MEDNVFQYNNLTPGDAVASAVLAGILGGFRRNTVRHNGALGGADLWTVKLLMDPDVSIVSDNVLTDNRGARTTLEVGNGGTIRNNTIANNQTFIAVYLHSNQPSASYEFVQNVVTHGQYDGLSCGFSHPGATHVIACNDVWGQGESYAGDCSNLEGQNGNFSSDPLFCDPIAGDYRLMAESPCAPGNSPPGCGLIGALPVGCGAAGIAASEPPASPVWLIARGNPSRFGAEFTIEPPSESLLLEIYDQQGRAIDVLRWGADRVLNWTPREHVPSGVYFARLKGTGVSKATKFVLLH